MKKRIAGILTAALIGTTVMGTVAMAAPFVYCLKLFALVFLSRERVLFPLQL